MGRATFLYLSSSPYAATGGGQRPAQLSRALARQGHEVAFYHEEDACWRSGGLQVLGPSELGPWCATRRGIALCTLPQHLHLACRLAELGWAIVYDSLDDWTAFAAEGDLSADMLDGEDELMRLARLVTCTAPRLERRARALGATRTALIRNGGPGPLSGSPPAWEPGDPVRVCFVGALEGTWFDWTALEYVAAQEDCRLTVVGELHAQVPRWPGVTYMGAMANPDAIDLMARHHVGVVPFHGPIAPSVDPIKVYEYWAAGCWVVASEGVEALRGRPYMRSYTQPYGIGAAIHAAVQSRRRQPVDPDFVAGTSWDWRASELLAALCLAGLLPESAGASAPPRLDLSEPVCSVCGRSSANAAMLPIGPYEIPLEFGDVIWDDPIERSPALNSPSPRADGRHPRGPQVRPQLPGRARPKRTPR